MTLEHAVSPGNVHIYSADVFIQFDNFLFSQEIKTVILALLPRCSTMSYRKAEHEILYSPSLFMGFLKKLLKVKKKLSYS